MPLEKHGGSLGDLVERVRRIGADTADLERLLDAAAALAHIRAAEAARRRRWRLAHNKNGYAAYARRKEH